VGVIFTNLPKIVVVILSALITYQAALLTWSLYPKEKKVNSWVPPVRNNAAERSILNTRALQEQHLFGQYKGEKAIPQAEQTIQDAPKTRLKLLLVGIVATKDPQYSSVIIESKGNQDTYFVDSKIIGTKATVSEIYSDRIIIEVNGAKQTLILDGVELEGNARTNKPKARTASKRARATIDLDRKELLSDPGKLLDFINISPVREGSEIKGYRVKPGKDPSLFEEAGLVDGDLAVELNGVDLTDMGEAMGLMKEFPTMTDISLTVDRDGELHQLFFSIP